MKWLGVVVLLSGWLVADGLIKLDGSKVEMLQGAPEWVNEDDSRVHRGMLKGELLHTMIMETWRYNKRQENRAAPTAEKR